MINSRNNKRFSCCFNCEYRFVGCHAICTTYLEDVKKNREYNDLIFEKKKMNRDIVGYEITKRKKYKKKR